MTNTEYVAEIWLQNDDAVPENNAYPIVYIRHTDTDEDYWPNFDRTGFTCIYKRPEPKFKVGDVVVFDDAEDYPGIVRFVGNTALVAEYADGVQAWLDQEYCEKVEN